MVNFEKIYNIYIYIYIQNVYVYIYKMYIYIYIYIYSVMETVIIPIVKSRKGDISSMENYTPIAITTIISKVIELLILDKYSSLLSTHDNQFGFKSNHGTDLCIFALQQVI